MMDGYLRLNISKTELETICSALCFVYTESISAVFFPLLSVYSLLEQISSYLNKSICLHRLCNVSDFTLYCIPRPKAYFHF